MNPLPKLLYLTTEYPHVSHTFIRREIVELESKGYEVFRAALRRGNYSVNPADISEVKKTFYILELHWVYLLGHLIRGLFISGFRLFPACAEMAALYWQSNRGLLRHLAYYIEALVLCSQISNRAIDHIHVHFGTNAASVALLVSKLMSVSFSMTVHGPDEFDAPISFGLDRKLRAAKFTIAITSFCRAQLFRWVEPAYWKRVNIVGCSVGDNWFKEGQPLVEGQHDFVCVGRFSEQKGQLLLLEAFSIALQKGVRGNLRLIGDGPLRPEIECAIEQYGLQHRVEILGWLNEQGIQKILRSSRALVLPSFAEGLPVVIMEAMACQRPIISTQITGIPELVRQEVDGLLVTAGHLEELISAFITIDNMSIESLNEMGRAGSRRVHERHRAHSEVEKLSELFRTVKY